MDEISEKVLQFQKTKSDEDFEFILDKMIGMIEKHIKINKYSEDAKDLRQELHLNLYQTCLKYNPSFGVKFSTYAFCNFKLAVRDWMDSRQLIYVPRQTKYKYTPTYVDTDFISFSKDWINEDRIDFEKLLHKLKSRQLEVLKLHFEGYSLKEMSKILNISHEQVRQILIQTKNIITRRMK